jgi:tetratricopeptide (TPR) repeat protein
MSTASESSPRHQRAQVYFKTGNDAALKSNFDYAIQMYQDACKLVPENLLYRQALRGVERRKFNNDPAKVGRLVGAKLQPARLRISTAKAKGQWAHVLEVCEEVFVHSPWDVGAARDLAEAAEKLDLKELARWSLESVHAQGLDKVDFLRHEARVYELNGDWQKAIDCWERVRKLAPTDEDAKRQINSLSANATIYRSGLSEAINKRAEGVSGPEAAKADSEELKLQALSPEERLQKEIEQQPDRAGPYLQLADLHKRQNKLDEAEKVLARGVKANPGDDVLRSAHADVQIARLRRAIDAWTKRAADHPDDADARTRLGQLQQKLDDYELNELRRRVATHSQDMNLRYQLGVCLARLGQHGAAIAEFQQARSSPAHRVQALHQAGLSFEADGNPKLAERCYLDALKAADQDDPAILNSLNYHLGRVYESMGNREKAEEHYNEVAANDYSYLDVAQRLRDLYKKPEA